MIRNNLTYFRTDDYTEDIRGIMAKMRYIYLTVREDWPRHSLLKWIKRKSFW